MAETGYRIWGVDNVVYGPVELDTLKACILEGRVLSDTWIFSGPFDAWHKASELAEVAALFPSEDRPKPAKGPNVSDNTVMMIAKPGTLRRVKVLADFRDDQLLRFVRYMEVLRVEQWHQVVKQGDHGDAMFMVLEGELRVRMMIGGKETILVTLGPGDFFGEISLFDHGPRSADVLANQKSLLVKISASAFDKLVSEAPDLAAPFLFAMGRTLTARIRADNKRYRDSVIFARHAGSSFPPPADH